MRHSVLASIVLAIFGITLASFPATAADGIIPNKTWVGEMSIGGSLATGNTDRYALDADGKVRYRAGRVEDKYTYAADFARESGSTTARRLKAGYQTNIDIQDGLFALAFVNGEDNRFSGFDYELEGGIGAGYRILHTSSVTLSIEGGPGYRYGRVKPPLSSEKEIFARGSAELDYKISDNAHLSDEISISWDDERTKVENTLAITSKIIGAVSGRTSFNFRYNSSPPGVTVEKTDTITKVALVYSF